MNTYDDAWIVAYSDLRRAMIAPDDMSDTAIQALYSRTREAARKYSDSTPAQSEMNTALNAYADYLIAVIVERVAAVVSAHAPKFTFNDSSVLESGRYWYDTQTLVLKLRSGNIYDYVDVPRHIWAELISAESAGQYYNRNIKGRYDVAVTCKTS